MFRNFNASFLGISGTQSEVIELALTYGFDSLDFDVVDFANRAKLRGIDYARRLIDSAKIRVGTFQFPFSWESDEPVFRKEMQRLPEYAEAAAALGCTRCLATVAPATGVRPYHENFEFHRTRFAEICEVFQKTNTWLGIGFRAATDLRQGKAFQFIHEQDALGLLMNMVGMPNIGMVLDLWDYVVAGGDVENIRNIPVNQIVAVQIAEMPQNTPVSELKESNRLLPGANGKPDLGAALRILHEAGYEGPVTIKPSKTATDARRRDSMARTAGVAMNRAWKAAGLPGTHAMAIINAERDREDRQAHREAAAGEPAQATEVAEVAEVTEVVEATPTTEVTAS